MSQPDLSIARHFAALPDPRVDRTKRHKLQDILVIALCAVPGGGDSFDDMEEFGNAKRAWFERFLELPNGVPSHDTFNRVFAALNPRAFQDCFVGWMNAVCERCGLRGVQIDGKAVRGTAGKNALRGCLHLVSVWAQENGLTLGQEAVADHSNVSSSAYPFQKLNCWTLPSRSCLSWASVFGVSGNKYRPFSRCLLIWIVPLWMRSCSQCGGTSSRLAS
jgi:hypothetical protein